MSLDYNQMKDLIQTVNGSSLHEFEMTLDNAHVRMSKSSFGGSGTAAPMGVAAAPMAAMPTAPAAAASPQTPAPPAPQAATEPGQLVEAPIVGTFYASGGPGQPNFVQTGDSVKKGSALCIIEAMKVMNEITSPCDGRVAEILAKNEDMVEYGQPLFRIVP